MIHSLGFSFSLSIITAISVPTSASALVESGDGAEELTIPVATLHINNQDGPTSQELPVSTAGPLDEAQVVEIAPLTVNSASTSVAKPLAPVNSKSMDSAAAASVVNSPTPINLDHAETPSDSRTSCAPDSFGDSSPARAPGDQSKEFIQPITENRSNGDADMIMADDMNLPAYLTGMISYLHGVAADGAWQDLVMHFVAFEKMGWPENGVSAM